jgi:acetyl-CoA C-acetyltransferase
MPFNAYIVECVRTAGGKKNGRLSKYQPGDLGAALVNALLEKTGMDGALVDDVIIGCVSQVGSQSANLGRNIVLGSKLPETVPGVTIDRQCGSSQQAIHFAAQAVMSGTQDVVIAGGVEVMSLVPIGAGVMDGMSNGRGHTMSDSINKKYPDVPGGMFSQFVGADMLARKHGITREDMEKSAVKSHARAVVATKEGRFKREIIALPGKNKDGSDVVHDVDEGIRPKTTMESLAKLSPLNPGDDGRITAGLASQICDGAAMVLICNEAGLKKLGLRPRARIVGLGLAGSDPIVMLGGPIPATENVLKRCKLTIKDMDLYEVNEAFASVPLAWAKAVGADLERLNVNGGAMALGHPLGGTGAKLMTTLVCELERTKKRYGLLAICEGGGTANATIIERMDNNQSKL